MSYIIVFLLAIEFLIVIVTERLSKIYDVLLDIKKILKEISKE